MYVLALTDNQETLWWITLAGGDHINRKGMRPIAFLMGKNHVRCN